jgi:hypothetical protein
MTYAHTFAESIAACMAEIEHSEKYNWWLNELDSLGIIHWRKME